MISHPNGHDHQRIVLYVEIHFYSGNDVRLLISKFTSLFRAAECKFPVQALEIQTYSSRYQAVMIQLQRQQYFTELCCNQHCSSSKYFSETLKSMGWILSPLSQQQIPDVGHGEDYQGLFAPPTQPCKMQSHLSSLCLSLNNVLEQNQVCDLLQAMNTRQFFHPHP